VLQEKFKEAAVYFEGIRGQLAGGDLGRATLLQLYGLIKAGDTDGALRLAMTEYPRVGEMAQLVGFQTLLLELGSGFLEAGEHRKAIACLQRVWTRDRLLKHQQQRLATLRQNLERAEQTKAAPEVAFQLRQVIGQVEKELKTFEGVAQFDSALRFRLASAFLGMDRYREAALLMESMLEEMPPDNVVEQASVNLVQCWMQTERWPKAVATAISFAEKFPKSKQLPLVLLMKGQAQQSDYLYTEAVQTFAELLKLFPKHELAPRALFMQGFNQLLLEEYPAALATLESLPKKHPKSDLAETAFYWRGMALSMAMDFEKARGVFDQYLTAHPEGTLRDDATYRRAYCIHSLKNYEESIREIRGFLEQFPNSEYRSEALVLLGDALMATGEIESGIAAYQAIPPGATKFFEEGWFKIGKALRLQEKTAELREHMLRFRQEHAKSPRVAEALYWIGWAHRAEGEPEKALDVYWDAINEFGDDPTVRSVEDFFPALAKLYKGEEQRTAYSARLRDLLEEADDAGKKTLAARALWAQAQLLHRSEPSAARKLLIEAAPRVDVQTANPLLLADIADAFRESGDINAAEPLYRDLLKWNPRAPQKDRAFAGLGLIAKLRGRDKAALDYFTRFEQETAGSPLFGEVMLAKAAVHAERGQVAEAQAALESLLADKTAPGSEKAQALFQIGELHMREKKPALAVPYYQRVYIMHGRWAEFVAKAYLRSGEAFEQLDDRAAATKTYQEMLGRTELSKFAEAAAAKERLAKLEGAL
jgi:tetratricopeptide (TPR) repeat protein